MLNKSFLLSALVCLVVFSSGWGLGSYITANRYQEEMQAKEIAVLEAQQKERKEHDARLIEATNQLRDELNRTTDLARSRGADVERLRIANTKLQARAKTSATSTDAEALARCSALLSEGAGLVAEGEGLLLKHGAEHDALVDIQK